jgi:hypothetical protein
MTNFSDNNITFQGVKLFQNKPFFSVGYFLCWIQQRKTFINESVGQGQTMEPF